MTTNEKKSKLTPNEESLIQQIDSWNPGNLMKLFQEEQKEVNKQPPTTMTLTIPVQPKKKEKEKENKVEVKLNNIFKTNNPTGIFTFLHDTIMMSRYLNTNDPSYINRAYVRIRNVCAQTNPSRVTIPYNYYYSKKNGGGLVRRKSENSYRTYHPSTKFYPGKQKMFYLFIPPEYMVQLPSYSNLTREHLKIVPNLWAWGPNLANKLLTNEEIKIKSPTGNDIKFEHTSWFVESKEFNVYRRDCIRYFGWKNNKAFEKDGGFKKEKFSVGDDGYIDYISCGGRYKNVAVIGQLISKRTTAELEVLKHLSTAISDLENIKSDVMNGNAITSKRLPDSLRKFSRAYVQNVKDLKYGRDVVDKLKDDND